MENLSLAAKIFLSHFLPPIFRLRDANSKGISNMILDVMGNGGGYICLSYATLRFFAKSWENPSVFQPYDFRESPTTGKKYREYISLI